MITFLDLIQKDDFRDFVKKRIAGSTETAYTFPRVLPKLYKYRSLSPYAVNDIINEKITLTSIGEFNDIFDGAIHQYGSMEEIEKAAEAKWAEIDEHRVAARLPNDFLRRDDIIDSYIEHFKTESQLKFRELDYLGTYVCCFSKDSTSTLMWAHYADSNKGICIEYEFDKLPPKNLLRDSIFPIAYTKTPIDVNDLIEDRHHKIYEYPIDAAVLCSALNKSSIWEYEKEWRIIWVLASQRNSERRFVINSLIHPSKVYLGYHFLKPFFYYSFNNKSECETCAEMIRKFMELIAYVLKNNIPIAVMIPLIGSYRLKPCDIATDHLYSFMLKHFTDNQPQNIRYYYTIHDDLMELIEKHRRVLMPD